MCGLSAMGDAVVQGISGTVSKRLHSEVQSEGSATVRKAEDHNPPDPVAGRQRMECSAFVCDAGDDGSHERCRTGIVSSKVRRSVLGSGACVREESDVLVSSRMSSRAF